MEGKKLRDSFESFQKAGVEILGISFDTPAENKAFAEKFDFPYRLLSDTDRRLGVAVGAADSPDAGYANRISYLVGPGGKVLRAYAKVSPADHADEVLADAART